MKHSKQKIEAPPPIRVREALRLALRLRCYALPLLPTALVVLGLALVQADLVLGATTLGQRLIDAFIPGGALGKMPTPTAAWLSAPAVDWFSAPGSKNILVAGLVCLMLAGEALGFGVEQLRFRIAQKFRATLQADLLDAFLRDTGASRQDRDPALAQTIFGQDAGSLGMLLIFGLLSFLEQSVKLSIYCVGLSRLTPDGWKLAAILVPLAFLFKTGILRVFLRWEQRTSTASSFAMLNAQRVALDFFALMARLVYLGGETKQRNALLEAADTSALANRRFQAVSTFHHAVSNLLTMLALPLAAVLMLRLNVSPGIVIQAQFLFTAILQCVSALMSFPSQFIQFAPALQRVVEALVTPPAGPQPPELETLLRSGPPSLRAEGLTFAYDPAGKPLLRSVSFEAPAGAFVCIVGGSGAGKSTLARLLIGERQSQSGRLFVGGVEITPWHLSWRRQVIAFLPAEVGLLQDTVQANLRFGRSHIPDEALEKAAAECRLEEVVARHGSKSLRAGQEQLSTGEQRKLGVARLLLGNQLVWIIDEPLANLDPRHMSDVAAAIHSAAGGHTTLVITHDPDFFHSDFNVFLHEGQVMATGKHEDLLRECGPYAEFYAQHESDRRLRGKCVQMFPAGASQISEGKQVASAKEAVDTTLMN